MPPLSGFAAKLALVQAGLSAGQGLLVGVALVVSVLTLFVMMRIWSEVFWRPPPASGADETPGARGGLGPAIGATLALVGLAAALGVGAAPVFAVTLRAAEELLDPGACIVGVLGE